jgi:hypothetical protein
VDRVPNKLPNTSSRLIAMAISLAGSAEAVMARMHCSPTDFAEYQAGRKEPTWAELERLVELIVSEQARLIEANRERVARVRAALRKE